MEKRHCGRFLEKLLIESGLSKKAFCKKLGIDKKTLRDVSSGKIRITTNLALRLEAAGLCDARLLLIYQVNLDLKNFDYSSLKNVSKIDKVTTVHDPIEYETAAIGTISV